MLYFACSHVEPQSRCCTNVPYYYYYYYVCSLHCLTLCLGVAKSVGAGPVKNKTDVCTMKSFPSLFSVSFSFQLLVSHGFEQYEVSNFAKEVSLFCNDN